MDIEMAPPLKRRKLSDSASQDRAYEERYGPATADVSTPFADFQDSLDSYGTVPIPSPLPHVVEELHVQIEEHPVGGIAHFQALLPRQGTGSSAAVSATITSSATASSGDGNTSISTGGPSTASSNTESTESSQTAGSAVSILASALESNTSSASISGTISGTTTSAISATSASLSSYISSNTTSVASTMPSSSASSSNAQISAAGVTASSLGLNSSNVSFIPTVTVGPSVTNSSISLASQSTLLSSANTTEPVLFLATLSNSSLGLFTQSRSAYITTLEDGEVFTIPAISASPTGSFELSSTTLADGSTSVVTITTPATDSSQSTVTSIAYSTQTGGAAAGAGQGQAPGSTTSAANPSSSSLTPTNNNNNSNDTPPPPAGTIAGGVVGGAAGLAVIVLIAMLFIRWYRRRSQMSHQQLSANSMLSPDLDRSSSPSGPGMAERAGLMPLVGAVPAFLRHQNRSLEDSEPGSERGFTRVSGRKLPSQFSPGMTSNDTLPGMPLAGGAHDRDPFDGHRPSDEDPRLPEMQPLGHQAAQETMTMSPGPRRQPTIHRGGPYVLTPSGSETPMPPAAGTSATFDRSDDHSMLDSQRNSRFSEEVG